MFITNPAVAIMDEIAGGVLFTGLAGVGGLTLALLKFAYGVVKDQIKSKDDEIARLRDELSHRD